MYLLRITLKSFQKINQLKQNLLKLNNFKNIKINGIFQVKNKNKIFTLLRSPHVNKKSREHFIYKNYTPKIDINFLNLFQLLNFLILLKKKFSKNSLINIKIIKKN
nr:40S ribosomal protein S10 [Phytophthora constricta]UXG53569.1 ribosomal protein S10 [Phytophthora constricta]